MNQKCFFKWFQLLLKRDQAIELDQSNWLAFVSEVLDVICGFQIENINQEGDIFQRKQIQSIIELFQKLISILKNYDDSSINELLKFIFLVCRDIPEIEQLTQQIDEKDQYQIFKQINLTDNQIMQLCFSKYELLQLIEHVEEKYKQTKEQLELITPQFQKAEESLKQSIIVKEEENKILKKQIEELIGEIDQLNINNTDLQISLNQIIKQKQSNPDQSQLLQYLQRQHCVIEEQERELDELRKIFSKKQMSNIFQDKENYNNIQTLENKVFLYADKLNQLNQQYQAQRTDMVRLEIEKSFEEKKYYEKLEQKDQEIKKLKLEIDEIQKQNQKMQYELTTRSKIVSFHSQSSKQLLAQELQDSQLKTQNLEKNSIDEIQANTVYLAQIEQQYIADKEQYNQIIENLMIDLKNFEKLNQDLKRENNQIQQNYQHLLKIKYESNLSPKIKKIELQNELLKKIVDAFILTNQQS